MKTIKIKKDHKKHLKAMINREIDANIMMEHGAEIYRITHKEFWEFLDKEYSLNLSNSTRYSFSSKKMEITQTK